jgi:hypothetical protein
MTQELVFSESDEGREVYGLGLCFKTLAELKRHGYAFAFRYGSETLARAVFWLDFSGLRRFRKQIETGPIDLRDALDAAFGALDGKSTIELKHIAVLREHTDGWFGQALEVRRLLAVLVQL